MSLQVRGLYALRGHNTVLHPLDLNLAGGEFLVVLGPSGSGKSTLLRLLMGVDAAAGGEIHLDGRRIDTLPPERRDVAMVFQNYALFPHLDVRRNLLFGLRMKLVPEAEQVRRLEEVVAMCRIGPWLHRLPHQLSGGQRQRVALARALVMRPSLMLFDEPLSNLDVELRAELREELLGLHRRLGMTCVYVTHDQEDAMILGDQVLLLDSGRAMEVGTPRDLYHRPATAFAASFFARADLVELPLDPQSNEHAILPWGMRAALHRRMSGPIVKVMLRHADFALAPDTTGPGVIENVRFLGGHTQYTVRADGRSWPAQSGTGEAELQVGERVSVSPRTALHCLG